MLYKAAQVLANKVSPTWIGRQEAEKQHIQCSVAIVPTEHQPSPIAISLESGWKYTFLQGRVNAT